MFTNCAVRLVGQIIALTETNVFLLLVTVLAKDGTLHSQELECVRIGLFLIYFMFYQLLHVQHGCSSTQSWGSVLPSIVETRDQNSRGCPLLFSNRNLGSFCA